MNWFWNTALNLSKSYLFIGGEPKKSPQKLIAKVHLYISIKLFQVSYSQNRLNGALFYVGKCFQSLNDHENALKYFKRAWDTDPFNSILCKEIGTTCLKMESYEEGLQYALKEVSQFPNDSEAKANLAFFLYKNNRLKEAKKVSSEAKNMDLYNNYILEIYEMLHE